MKEHEARALIVAAGVALTAYSKAKKALDFAKEQLGEYLEQNNLENLDGPDAGSGVRFVTPNNRVFNINQCDEDTVLWLWREGKLTLPISKYDEIDDENRAILKGYVSTQPGTTYVNVYYPDWGTKQQHTKEAKRAPSNTPVPIRPKALTQPEGTPQAESGQLPNCPEHGANTSGESKKFNGRYCRARVGEAYCDWVWHDRINVA